MRKCNIFAVAIFSLLMLFQNSSTAMADNACFNYSDHIRCDRSDVHVPSFIVAVPNAAYTFRLGNIRNISQSEVTMTMYNGNPGCMVGVNPTEIRLQPGDIYEVVVRGLLECPQNNDRWEWRCRDGQGSTVCNTLTYIYQ